MSIDQAQLLFVVGGQFGSEGKGRIVGDLVLGKRRRPFEVHVRVGGPQAGHTVWVNDKTKLVFKSLPIGTLDQDAISVIGQNAVVDLDLISREMELLEQWNPQHRVFLDPRAVVVQDKDREYEQKNLEKEIGSTAQGVGAARARKILRVEDALVMHQLDRVHKHVVVADTTSLLADAIADGRRVLFEGTQGIGLGLHAGFYPHATSADITPSAIWADCGLPLHLAHNLYVLGIYRFHPIRVGGPSGPLHRETNWEELGQAEEITTVTKRVRRVGHWDAQLAKQTVTLAGVDGVALTFADYMFNLDPKLDPNVLLTAWDRDKLARAKEIELGRPVVAVSHGPKGPLAWR